MALNIQNSSLASPMQYEIAKVVREAEMSDDGLVDVVAYAATITQNMSGLSKKTVVVAALTGNITVAAPLNPRVGQRLAFCFTQDATGGRTVTWNAAFAAAANSGSTANHKAATEFVYDGSRWVQLAGAMTFKA